MFFEVSGCSFQSSTFDRRHGITDELRLKSAPSRESAETSSIGPSSQLLENPRSPGEFLRALIANFLTGVELLRNEPTSRVLVAISQARAPRSFRERTTDTGKPPLRASRYGARTITAQFDAQLNAGRF